MQLHYVCHIGERNAIRNVTEVGLKYYSTSSRQGPERASNRW